MDEQKLKEGIKSISDNIGVPEHYIESAIRQAKHNYNSNNCSGVDYARKIYVRNGEKVPSLSDLLFSNILF